MTQDNVNKITIRLLPDGYSFLNQYHPVQRGADFIQRLKESLLEEAERCETPEATRYVCSVESVRFCLSPLAEDIDPEACYRFCLSEAEQEETEADDEFADRFHLVAFHQDEGGGQGTDDEGDEELAGAAVHAQQDNPRGDGSAYVGTHHDGDGPGEGEKP